MDVLLKTEQTFPPPEEFAEQANANDPAIYEQAAADPEKWWASWADQLEWIEPYDEVLDWSDPPFAKWFVGGKLNASVNCLDRHVDAGRGDRVAFLWEGENGDRREVTYAELLDTTQRFANVLKGLGVGKGDVVGIYLPMLPETPAAMLACARIGADPQRRLRRLLGHVGRRADGVLGREGPGHRRRDDAPRRADPDEGRARRGARRPAGPRARDRRQPRRHRPPDDRGPRRLLGAGRRRRRPDLRARADGLRGPALHPLHVGFDRQAEGHPAHDRRLPDPGRGYPQARLRPRATTTSTGAAPTSAGSRATATSSTGRWSTARPP